VAFSFNDEAQSYSYIINEFNNYSKENNLNIEIKLNLFTTSNTTYSLNDHRSMIESLLIKNSDRYDIYFYNNLNTSKFGPYLLDLNELLSKNETEIFNADILSKSCWYKDKLVGLVNIYFFFFLIFNIIDKYIKIYIIIKIEKKKKFNTYFHILFI